MAAVLPVIASVVGIGSGVNSLTGGALTGGGGGSASAAYQPTGQAGADQAWQSFMKQLQGDVGGSTGQFNPAIMQAFSQMMQSMPNITAAGNAAQGADWANSGLASQYGTLLENAGG